MEIKVKKSAPAGPQKMKTKREKRGAPHLGHFKLALILANDLGRNLARTRLLAALLQRVFPSQEATP